MHRIGQHVGTMVRKWIKLKLGFRNFYLKFNATRFKLLWENRPRNSSRWCIMDEKISAGLVLAALKNFARVPRVYRLFIGKYQSIICFPTSISINFGFYLQLFVTHCLICSIFVWKLVDARQCVNINMER